MIKTAVLLTVFNRREVTLKGLWTLYRAIEYLQKERPDEGYQFDIYMTDDGCTDGTGDAVTRDFPDVQIVKGDGNLYWSGGMRKAWQAAITNRIKYDYYLWFNDDAVLYEDALSSMFDSINNARETLIVSGAFCDKHGAPSYGGKNEKHVILEPSDFDKEIVFMNGNLVLIPNEIYTSVGSIDIRFSHGLGDFDYGLRAREMGYKVILSRRFVGICCRHDDNLTPYWNRKINIIQRLRLLYSPRNDINEEFYFLRRHEGIYKAVITYSKRILYALIPELIKIIGHV